MFSIIIANKLNDSKTTTDVMQHSRMNNAHYSSIKFKSCNIKDRKYIYNLIGINAYELDIAIYTTTIDRVFNFDHGEYTLRDNFSQENKCDLLIYNTRRYNSCDLSKTLLNTAFINTIGIIAQSGMFTVNFNFGNGNRVAADLRDDFIAKRINELIYAKISLINESNEKLRKYNIMTHMLTKMDTALTLLAESNRDLQLARNVDKHINANNTAYSVLVEIKNLCLGVTNIESFYITNIEVMDDVMSDDPFM